MGVYILERECKSNYSEWFMVVGCDGVPGPGELADRAHSQLLVSTGLIYSVVSQIPCVKKGKHGFFLKQKSNGHD